MWCWLRFWPPKADTLWIVAIWPPCGSTCIDYKCGHQVTTFVHFIFVFVFVFIIDDQYQRKSWASDVALACQRVLSGFMQNWKEKFTFDTDHECRQRKLWKLRTSNMSNISNMSNVLNDDVLKEGRWEQIWTQLPSPHCPIIPIFSCSGPWQLTPTKK